MYAKTMRIERSFFWEDVYRATSFPNGFFVISFDGAAQDVCILPPCSQPPAHHLHLTHHTTITLLSKRTLSLPFLLCPLPSQVYIVPRLPNMDAGNGLQLKLVGLIVHGLGIWCFLIPPWIKDDSNLMIHLLRLVLADAQEKRAAAGYTPYFPSHARFHMGAYDRSMQLNTRH